MSSLSGGKGYSGGDIIPKGYNVAQLQNYDPQQQELYQRNFQQVAPDSYTARLAGGDQSLFTEIEDPAMRQFAALQGNTASRFSGGGGGRGAMSSRRSSGFQNTMNQATSDFAGQLQSQRMSLRNQAIKDLMSMSHQMLNENPTERYLAEKPEKKKSFLENLMKGGSGLAGGAIGGYFGGPAGAKVGFDLGNSFSEAF